MRVTTSITKHDGADDQEVGSGEDCHDYGYRNIDVRNDYIGPITYESLYDEAILRYRLSSGRAQAGSDPGRPTPTITMAGAPIGRHGEPAVICDPRCPSHAPDR